MKDDEHEAGDEERSRRRRRLDFPRLVFFVSLSFFVFLPQPSSSRSSSGGRPPGSPGRWKGPAIMCSSSATGECGMALSVAGTSTAVQDFPPKFEMSDLELGPPVLDVVCQFPSLPLYVEGPLASACP